MCYAQVEELKAALSSKEGSEITGHSVRRFLLLKNIIDSCVDEDVKKTVYGKWRPEENYYSCSNCKAQSSNKTNYCPHCGAQMREVKR